MKFPKVTLTLPAHSVTPKGYAPYFRNFYTEEVKYTWYGLHILFALVIRSAAAVFCIGIELTKDNPQVAYMQGHADGAALSCAEYAEELKEQLKEAEEKGYERGYETRKKQYYNEGYDVGYRAGRKMSK